MMLGWSEPRLTKQWDTPASQSAWKKAEDVVYILCSAVCTVAFLLQEFLPPGYVDDEREKEEY